MDNSSEDVVKAKESIFEEVQYKYRYKEIKNTTSNKIKGDNN